MSPWCRYKDCPCVILLFLLYLYFFMMPLSLSLLLIIAVVVISLPRSSSAIMVMIDVDVGVFHKVTLMMNFFLPSAFCLYLHLYHPPGFLQSDCRCYHLLFIVLFPIMAFGVCVVVLLNQFVDAWNGCLVDDGLGD